MTAILDRTILDKALADFSSGDIQWTKGWGNKDTRTCLHGAILRPCEHPVDAILWSVWLGKSGYTMHWNDTHGSSAQVIKALRAVAEPNEDNMLHWFGPNWQVVVEFIRRAVTVTPAQAVKMLHVINAISDDICDAVWDAEDASDCRKQQVGAVTDVLHLGKIGQYGSDGNGIRLAACALVVKDLITPSQYEILTRSWVSVMGPMGSLS